MRNLKYSKIYITNHLNFKKWEHKKMNHHVNVKKMITLW